MTKTQQLQHLARTHGTPLFIVDHAVIRSNYAAFKRFLPRVQAYYAVKANPDPAIIKTLYDHINPDLIAVHKEAAKINLKTITTGSPIPFHPGAVKFYTEKGIMVK